jgi:hypothetical protein
MVVFLKVFKFYNKFELLIVSQHSEVLYRTCYEKYQSLEKHTSFLGKYTRNAKQSHSKKIMIIGMIELILIRKATK